jgi:hypothetical protein
MAAGFSSPAIAAVLARGQGLPRSRRWSIHPAMPRTSTPDGARIYFPQVNEDLRHAPIAPSKYDNHPSRMPVVLSPMIWSLAVLTTLYHVALAGA